VNHPLLYLALITAGSSVIGFAAGVATMSLYRSDLHRRLHGRLHLYWRRRRAHHAGHRVSRKSLAERYPDDTLAEMLRDHASQAARDWQLPPRPPMLGGPARCMPMSSAIVSRPYVRADPPWPLLDAMIEPRPPGYLGRVPRPRQSGEGS